MVCCNQQGTCCTYSANAFDFLIGLKLAFETLNGSSSSTGLLIYLKELLSSSYCFSNVSKNPLMSKFQLNLPALFAFESAYLNSLNCSSEKVSFQPFINSTIILPLTKNSTFGYRTDLVFDSSNQSKLLPVSPFINTLSNKILDGQEYECNQTLLLSISFKVC